MSFLINSATTLFIFSNPIVDKIIGVEEIRDG